MSSWEMIGSPLIEFLKKNTTTDNKKITHQLLPGVINGLDKYKYCILKEDYSTLIKLYHQHVFENKYPLSLMEKIGAVSPMFLDIDIKYCNDNNVITDKQYTKQTIELTCKLVFDEIKNHVIIDDDKRHSMSRCIVMEKPKIILKNEKNGDKIAKDGIHIIFPGIVIDRKLQQVIIKTLCSEDNGHLTADIFETLKTKPLEYVLEPDTKNPLQFIMDESIYKNGKMIMVGSQKPDNVAYEVTHIFNIGNELKYENKSMFDSYSLLELNSLYNCPDKKCEYYDDTELLLKDMKPLKKKFIYTQTENNEFTSKYIPTDRDVCKKLVEMLDIKRAEEYNSWINVGICLYNIKTSFLDLWIEFSKQSKKYKSGVCDTMWYKYFKKEEYNGCSLKIGSLYHWAKEDNPDKFKEHIKSTLVSFVESLCNRPSHANIARLIYKCAMNEYKCAGIDKKEWYYFNKNKGGKWLPMDGAINLRKYITNDMTELIDDYKKIFRSKANQLEDEGNDTLSKLYSDYCKTCGKMSFDMETSTFKDNIVKECRENYHDTEFTTNLDSNTQLFGFNNCIYDLTEGIFRMGEASDYISMSCGLDIVLEEGQEFPISIDAYYKGIVKSHADKYVGLNDFLNKILPNKDVRDYTLCKIASCVLGEVREEKFHIWTGCGGNGKS